MRDKTKKIAIIGAGITGLSVAHYLEKFLKPDDAEIFLLENDSRLGGKILTVIEDGFVIEGGPDSIYLFKPGAMELIKELHLEESIVRPPVGARAFIFSRGKLRNFPEGFYGLAPRDFIKFLKSDLFSFSGKFRMLLEPLIPVKDTGDETLGDFVRRRLGKEALSRYAGPLLSGIYAADPDDMSILATFPYYKDMERKYGSLTKAALRAPVKKSTGSPFLTLDKGLSMLVEAITQNLHRTQIVLDADIRSIEKDRMGYIVLGREKLQVDEIVFASPSFDTAKLLKNLSPEASRILKEIRYVSTLTISMAFREDGISLPPGSTGFMVARGENLRISACTFSSNKWPGHAPEGFHLIRCFLGRAGFEKVVDYENDEILEIALEDLRKVIGELSNPIFYRIFRWRKGMPQYRVGHLNLLGNLGESLPDGIHIVGAAYRGIGIPDCINQGRNVAKVLAEKYENSKN